MLISSLVTVMCNHYLSTFLYMRSKSLSAPVANILFICDQWHHELYNLKEFVVDKLLVKLK